MLMESVFVTKVIIASVSLVILALGIVFIWRKTMSDYDIVDGNEY